MVGTGRFELPTPRTPSECSTRLSHVPTKEERFRERETGVQIILHHRFGHFAELRKLQPQTLTAEKVKGRPLGRPLREKQFSSQKTI